MPGPSATRGARADPRRRQQILLADADIGVQATLSIVLAGRFLLTEACSVEEALGLSTRAAPDLLIVSATQPDLHPATLVRTLRAAVPGCPVFVVTDGGHVADAQRLVPLGIHGYFVKPLRFDDLFHQIARLSALWRQPGLGPFGAVVGDTVQYLSCQHPRFPTVRDLAARAGVSASHFSHVFSASMRMSPKEYVMRVRIEFAKRLLRRTTDKLDVIAAGLGFSDTSHLSRVFRARTGQTPGRFRRLPRMWAA